MRAAVADAERRTEVRSAALSWKRSGSIPEELAKTIAARYADDRVSLGPILRVLVFGFTVLFASGTFGFVLSIVSVGSRQLDVMKTLGLVFAGFAVAAAELLSGRLRRRRSGMESAAAALIVGFAMLPVADFNSVPATCLALAAISAVVAGRYGYALLQLLSVGAMLGSFVDGPNLRVAWAAIPLVAGAPFLFASASPRLAPPHRRGAAASFLLLVAALWLSTTVLPHDLLWSGVLGHAAAAIRPLPRPLAIFATAAIPIALLTLALRFRRRLLLAAGLATAAASLASIAHYVDLFPIWIDLALAGAAVLVGTELLRRFLDSGPEKERGGFTVQPLGAAGRIEKLAESAAAVAVFTPEARSPDAPADPGWQGGGGRSGGGGASGEF